jgi:hypothetical protein
MGENRDTYMLLVEKPEETILLGRPRWVDNIRMKLGVVGWRDVDSIGLVQDRNRWRALVNSVLDFGFHRMLGNFQVASELVSSQVVLSSMD